MSLLNRAFPFLELTGLDQLRLHYYEGKGASFPMHRDTHGESPQVLIGFLYLNPDWVPAHGGELRVYPFPFAPLDIAPLRGRLLVFSTKSLVHRVLPSMSNRYGISMMFWGN